MIYLYYGTIVELIEYEERYNTHLGKTLYSPWDDDKIGETCSYGDLIKKGIPISKNKLIKILFGLTAKDGVERE